MSEFNPYDAPNYKVDPLRHGFVNQPLFIANSALVVPKSSDLPDVCVFSGKVGNNIYVKKTLVACPSWVLLICILNLLLGAIVYMFVRKVGKLGYYVDADVASARFKLMLANWLIFLGSLGSIALAVATDHGEIAIACPIMILISLILYFAKIRGIYAEWVDHTTIGVKGIRLPVMERLIEAGKHL